MAQTALSFEPTPSVPVRLASGLLEDARAAFDSGLGPITIVRQQALDATVSKLLSDLAEQVKLGQAELNAMRAESAQSDLELAGLRQQLDQRNAELQGAYAERDAVASKWERRVRIVYFFAGSWVFISFVLPVLARAFPALGGVTTIAQMAFAPFAAFGKRKAEQTIAQVTSVANKAGQVRDDLIQAIESVRSQAKTSTALTREQLDAVLREYVTEADGTAAEVDARRRALKLI